MQTQTSNTLHNAIMEAGSKDRPSMLAPGWKENFILDAEGNPTTATEKVFETYKNVKQEIRDQLNAEAEAVQIILTGIDNDIYSTVSPDVVDSRPIFDTKLEQKNCNDVILLSMLQKWNLSVQ
nr:hypothetical protein [Tanacetum cinerariifolium]